MTKISNLLTNISVDGSQDKNIVIEAIIHALHDRAYKIEEINGDKPWGAYIRINNKNTEQFLKEFFPGLSFLEACLGVVDAEISPKILIVEGGKRLSWQMHHRRAERWVFLTEGAYYKSLTDEQGAIHYMKPGDTVQFAQGERHRLVGMHHGFAVVAEIWQHANPSNLSDENDIVRLEDDFSR